LSIVLLIFLAQCFANDYDNFIPDQSAATSETPPFHMKNWEQEHGPVLLRDADFLSLDNGCRTRCHGTDLRGGESGVKCHDCHIDPPFPHPIDWQKIKVHGQAAIHPETRFKCLKCHDTDETRSKPPKYCRDCHPVYPHDSQWFDPIAHGRYVIASGGPEICATQCHGLDYRNDVFKTPCQACHETYPHPTNWTRRHAFFVIEKSYNSCASSGACHNNPAVYNGKPFLVTYCTGYCHLGYEKRFGQGGK
jgi:hypothetical protein